MCKDKRVPRINPRGSDVSRLLGTLATQSPNNQNRLSLERLETRLLLASDVAVSATQLPSAGEVITYEVNVRNLGDAPVSVQVSQATDPLLGTEWRQINPFPNVVDLHAPNGGIDVAKTPWAKDGFYGYAIWGASAGFFGSNVWAGDVNADGIDDLSIGTCEAINDRPTFVVFGTTDERQDTAVRRLTLGDQGILLRSEWDGGTFSLGEFNGDGISDLLTRVLVDSTKLRTHIYFGQPGLNSLPNPDALDGTNGFTIDSAGTNVGDVNGDGVDDVRIAVLNRELFVEEFAYVYGSNSHLAAIDVSDLDGSNGSRWTYGTTHGRGMSSSVGDINGDGRADYFDVEIGKILMGTSDVDEHVSIDDLPPDRFVDMPDTWGVRSVGDLNGDGFGDVIHQSADSAVRILFGSEAGINMHQPDAIELASDFRSGYSPRFPDAVNSADINGDGLDDAIISDSSDPLEEVPMAGARGIVYVLYGSHEEYPDEIDLREYIDGETGFAIKGFNADDNFASDLAVGDFNGDGVDDLVAAGCTATTPNGVWSGAAHVVYGQRTHVSGSGPIESKVRIIPGRTITYTVEGQMPAEPSAAPATFTVALPDGIEDAFPSNNTFTLTFGDDLRLRGDINQDGNVAFADFLILAANFGKEDATPGEGDIDEDGIVTFEDLVILAENFGRRNE